MSLTKKIILINFFFVIIYVLGPKWPTPELNNYPKQSNYSINNIDEIVSNKESSILNIKPNNEAEIIWANDSNHIQTRYCFVYLPGFGASKGEGEPIHREIAERYGMNLFLARLDKQGIYEEEPFIDLKEEMLVESAKEAIEIGKILGEQVIIVCTSTGATLGFYLAANDPDIASIIAYSPNFDLADPMSDLLTGPWGLQLARIVLSSKYRSFEANDTIKKWWINKYRIEGLIALKSLLNCTMTNENFRSINQPIYIGYYYKNENEKDKIISIPRIKEVFNLLSTPIDKKRLVALKDVSGHCMASCYHSSEKQLNIVRKESFNFLENVLNLKPVK
ncbi:MAG: alpha/beta hydrolase [Saprospiraceae bacterium]|nr:alpha/beta hydrolase [Saprospiraceae bacterium]